MATPLTPAAPEAETGGSWFETNLGKKLVSSYLKNNLSVVDRPVVPATWEMEEGRS
jgi:hypothetical protein